MHRLFIPLMIAPFALYGCGMGTTQQEPVGEQMGQQADQLGQEAEQMGQQVTGQAQEQDAGTAQGTISDIDAEKGEITLTTTDGEELNIRARPPELQGMKQGDQAEITWMRHGGTEWMVPEGEGEEAWQDIEGAARMGTLTGTIENMDLGEGTLTVDGQELHAHPHLLEKIQQDQAVEIRMITVGQENWVVEMTPTQQRTGA